MRAKHPRIKKPVPSSQTPATSAMLYEMEGRLSHRMDKGFERMDSKFEGLRSEFHGLKSEMHDLRSDMHELKSEMHGLKSEVHGLRSDVHGIKSEVHRIALLVEEQNARNKFVMDGYAQIYELLTNKA